MSEETIEKELQDKKLNAPRLTPADIDAVIVSQQYLTPEHSTTIICCLTLKNGFTVTGESACASADNFDPEIGSRIAKEKARSKVWELEGYLLKQRLFEAETHAP